MRESMLQAIKQSKQTQEDVARGMHMGKRQLQRLIYGEQEMTPEEAMQFSRAANCPQFTMVYCRQACTIGRSYCYEVLNNVDLNISAILTCYLREEKEAHDALEKLMVLMLNKRNRDDCTETEIHELRTNALQLLDLEHVIETLKMRLWDFIDVAKLIRTHNQKCLEKRYYNPMRPELRLVG